MNFQRLIINALAFIILAAAGSLCAFAQDKQAEYQLGSGDNIRVQVFQNPDLTVE